MTNISASLLLTLLRRMPKWIQVQRHLVKPRKRKVSKWERVWPDCQLILRVLRTLRVWTFSSFVINYGPTFQVTLMEEEALTPVPGLLLETRVLDSAPLHPWSMRLLNQEIGHPHWELIFEHVLRQCGYLVEFHTVYVMVDNRDLANHQRQDSSLSHWPAAARWWHSRLKLIGPHKEKTELLLFPISASTGLHHVHPTWAGTFVLAALVAIFLAG